ncbi:MAG: hypothetical protein ABIB97_04440 [Patescibacteria group bacterium]
MSNLVLVGRVEPFLDEVFQWMRHAAQSGLSHLPGPIRLAYRGRIFCGEALGIHPEVPVILDKEQIDALDQFLPHARKLAKEGRPFGTSTEQGGGWAWLVPKNETPVMKRNESGADAIIMAIAWAASRDIFSHVVGLQFPMFQQIGGDNTDSLLVMRYAGPEPADEFQADNPSAEAYTVLAERIRRVHLGLIEPFVIEIPSIHGPVTLRLAPRA